MYNFTVNKIITNQVKKKNKKSTTEIMDIIKGLYNNSDK